MNDFIEAQLAVWPEARERYLNLGATERRRFKLGDLEGALQFNPARIVSTGAKTDRKSIESRPCFLCEKNRPKEQVTVPLLDNWHLLLNPFPIFPVHFTIASTDHRPQTAPPLEMAEMADKFPELAIFFNGAKAGASAPDHLHLQAVLKSELPLIALTEKAHPTSNRGIRHSSEFGLNLPFSYYSAVITPDYQGMADLRKMLSLTGSAPSAHGSEEGEEAIAELDPGLRNVIVWKDHAGWLRVITIPRRAHRPSNYGAGPGQHLVSPGTIDIAGVVIVPRREDFDSLTESDLSRIYAEVAFG